MSVLSEANLTSLEKLVNLFPKKRWDWGKLASNPNISWEFIKLHPGKINWYYVLSNPNLTLEIIESILFVEINNNLLYPGKKCMINDHPQNSYDTALNYIHHNNNCIPTLIDFLFYRKREPIIPIKVEIIDISSKENKILLNNKCHLNLLDFSSYQRIGMDQLCTDLLKMHGKNICKKISRHKLITWDIIYSFPEFPWNWYEISKNPNITWDIIYNNLDLSYFTMHRNDVKKYFNNFVRTPVLSPSWKWDFISKNKNITWDIIQSFPEFPWNWHEISRNPNITLDVITKNLNLQERFGEEAKWNWDVISYNPNITSDLVLLNLSYNWNFDNICRFLDINFKFLQKIISEKMIWSDIYKNSNFNIFLDDNYDENILDKNSFFYYYSNPNITYDFVLMKAKIKGKQGVNWNQLSGNRLHYNEKVRIQKISCWNKVILKIFKLVS